MVAGFKSERWPTSNRNPRRLPSESTGSKLRQKLIVRNPGRRGKTRFLKDLGSDVLRDMACKRNNLKIFRDIQVGFVERKRFDQLRVQREYLVDLSGNGFVNIKPRRHEYEVGALTFCGDQAIAE